MKSSKLEEFTRHLNIHSDKVYLKLSLMSFAIWLSFKGPIRNFFETDDFAMYMFLGIAPNLFAGVTLVFWQTYVTSSKPLLTLACVNAVLILAEFVQLFIATQTFDVLDLVAGFLGSTTAIGYVILNEKRRR